MNGQPAPPNWGRLPKAIINQIRLRIWKNSTALKARLIGKKPFPIRMGLKPPSGREAMSDMRHFQQFIGAWRTFPLQHFIHWDTVRFRDLSVQEIPKFLVLESMQDLIELLGSEAAARYQTWEENMSPLLKVDRALYPVLIKHLEVFEHLSLPEAELLANLIPQLSPGLGQEGYLRSLPLIGVDTKFVENHEKLIADILNQLHDGSVNAAGNLQTWLGCAANPKGWLTIRPLCSKTIANLGGFPLLQTTGDLLIQHELSASNILVVENLQSGLGLPEMSNTIAVIGGGKNISWMQAKWLKSKRCAYWGDIDTWGLSILSDARARLSQIQPLMMDRKTLILHEDRMVEEPEPVEICPNHLTETETALFNHLKSGVFSASRLEQERLSADYIRQTLEAWLSNTCC